MSSPQLPYQSRVIGVACYCSAKLTAKSKAKNRERGSVTYRAVRGGRHYYSDALLYAVERRSRYLLEEPNVNICLHRYTFEPCDPVICADLGLAT